MFNSYGGYNNSNSNGSNNSPTVYGRAFSNKESQLDQTMLSTSMWETTIRVSIAPLIKTGTDEVRYDVKNAISSYLTPMKAHMLAVLGEKFKEDPDKYTNCGVASGESLITFSNSKEFGKPSAGPSLVIRRVDGESGTVKETYSYEFRRDSYPVVKGFDQDTAKFTNDYDMFKWLELDAFISQLNEYFKAMTNAEAFSVKKAMHWDLKRIYSNQGKIANKLGVELDSNTGGYGRSSYFNNGITNNQQSSTTTPTSSTLQDIMS